ncbi:hypothetical protein NSK_005292 [Nannochloropsis salina CCMP1776]|uniref:Major facilitator superfamily (MFS) profile domain-containing protein n=1 Tax=Nannochloropsis salina CCMP1776 TaxID=1027361 RepID=A0A4D9CW41_9STRA|nr:hypothetical protein NSK_005292 [Nannochloropsis salina CCMP1776]|eukprot:TFJ83452.1 hypothetical protein NSK_005292 [Nannochloropsis salina CCMP1776]
MLRLPESPRWLAAQGKHEAAKASLGGIRQEEEVEGELAGMEAAVEDGGTMLGFGVQLLEQFSGINALPWYGVHISMIALPNRGTITASTLTGERRSLFAPFTFAASDYQNVKRLAGVIIACTALCTSWNFAYSWGPLAWVV